MTNSHYSIRLGKQERELAKLYKKPLYSVEVHAHTSKFPFKLFRKKPYDDSRNYTTTELDSYAMFGFSTRAEAHRFAESAASRRKDLTTRVFRLTSVNVDFDWKVEEHYA